MGYSYECRTGKLCCDSCGKAGGVRKCACPFGWCPPPALCADCRIKHATTLKADWHRERGCLLAKAEANLREVRKQTLLAEGKPVRRSALADKTGRVHVLFGVGEFTRECVGRYMARATYNAIDLMEPATPDDFAKFGEVTDAPAEFDFSA